LAGLLLNGYNSELVELWEIRLWRSRREIPLLQKQKERLLHYCPLQREGKGRVLIAVSAVGCRLSVLS
jgi:hypothetical protein